MTGKCNCRKVAIQFIFKNLNDGIATIKVCVLYLEFHFVW